MQHKPKWTRHLSLPASHPVSLPLGRAMQPSQLSKQRPAPFHIQSLNPVDSSSLIPLKPILSTLLPLPQIRLCRPPTLGAEPASVCFLRLHSDPSVHPAGPGHSTLQRLFHPHSKKMLTFLPGQEERICIVISTEFTHLLSVSKCFWSLFTYNFFVNSVPFLSTILLLL